MRVMVFVHNIQCLNMSGFCKFEVSVKASITIKKDSTQCQGRKVLKICIASRVYNMHYGSIR